MPTRRAWHFLLIAIILYGLANQTQVGWVYLISNVILGLIVTAFLYDLGALRGITFQRQVGKVSASGDQVQSDMAIALADITTLDTPALHEDDVVNVQLQFIKTKGRPALLIHGIAHCPFAPPNEQQYSFFIVRLAKGFFFTKGTSTQIVYQTHCDRRGHYVFSDISLSSKGPFGFFRRRASYSMPTEILVYPSYYAMQRWRILENSLYAPKKSSQVGLGSQIIGTREYRPGDALKTIHWRSTARRGELIVKEFAQDEAISITVAIDFAQDDEMPQDKNALFEVALRIATSFAHYAKKRKIAFHLAGSRQPGPVPQTALSWWATLDYLAKVKQNGVQPFDQVLGKMTVQSFVVVIVTKPNEALYQALTLLQQRSGQLLVLFIRADGEVPIGAQPLLQFGIQIKGVTPQNWEQVLQTL